MVANRFHSRFVPMLLAAAFVSSSVTQYDSQRRIFVEYPNTHLLCDPLSEPLIGDVSGIEGDFCLCAVLNWHITAIKKLPFIPHFFDGDG